MRRLPAPKPTAAAQRGSLLIVAMILCAVIGISLVSYLQLSRTALSLSNRGVYNNAAINLAEQGLEEAMYAINQSVTNTSYSWSDWNTHSVNDKRRKWEDVALSQSAEGEYRVYIYGYTGIPTAPKIVSRSSIQLGGSSSPRIEKWIEVTLAKTSKFANGLVAKTSVTFTGNNATVDSWNSDPSGTGATIQPYSSAAGVRNDNGSVGSISIATDAVVVQNADVWGYVSTGGTDPTAFVGSNGSILGNGSPPSSNVDPNRVSTNFSASFDAVATPTTTTNGTLGNLNATYTLPEGGDLPASDGYFYYDASSVNLTSDTLHITGKVILRVTGDVKTSGNGGITIGTGGSLAIYSPGTISLNGNGVMNGTDTDGSGTLNHASELGQAINFQVWGTATTSQNIDIGGNGLFSGVIYAPQGNISIVGNGAVCGSVVGNNINLSGTAEFHYDESLAKVGGGNPYRVAKWKELTKAADRDTYSADLTW